MYSWAGQLYTNLTAVYHGIKGMSAGLTGFSGIKNAYRGPRKTIAYEAHEWTLMQWGVLYDDNIDNGAYYIRHLARKMATASCPKSCFSCCQHQNATVDIMLLKVVQVVVKIKYHLLIERLCIHHSE